MTIDPRLNRIVAAQPYPLLFATISGAHLYGFPSPDSDFDLRGAHVLPVERVVGLEVHDETVQDSRVIEGLEMDIVSHDVKKFFGLLLKKNGYVLEQLYSPLIVKTTPEHAELKALCAFKSGTDHSIPFPESGGVITKHHSHHYFGFAETQWKLFLKESPRRVKPLLYVYRVLLTGIHLMRTGVIEANLVTLNEEFRLPYIADLVARKLAGPEKSVLNDADLAFHECEYQRLRGELQAAHDAIRHHAITNDYNDGANSLKNFLQYAEAVSKGDVATARRVLENLNPLSRKALAPLNKGDSVVENLATTLRGRGYEVDLNVGQSKFRCDLAVRGSADSLYQLGILVDTDGHYANPNLLDRYLMQPSILKAFGWRFTLVLTKDWYHNPEDVLVRIEKLLQGQDTPEETDQLDEESVEPIVPAALPQTAPKITVIEAVPDEHKETLEKPPVQTPAATQGSIRHFEFTGGSSNKFWEITLSGNSFTVRFGRIGTAGQSQTKTFGDEVKMKREAENLIGEKVKKGYVQTNV